MPVLGMTQIKNYYFGVKIEKYNLKKAKTYEIAIKLVILTLKLVFSNIFTIRI